LTGALAVVTGLVGAFSTGFTGNFATGLAEIFFGFVMIK